MRGLYIWRAIIVVFVGLAGSEPGNAADVSPESVRTFKNQIKLFYSPEYVAATANDRLPSRRIDFPFGFNEISGPPSERRKAAVTLFEELYKTWRPRRQCDLRGLKIPPITLVGELHSCPDCAADRELRIGDAVDGKVCLLHEAGDDCKAHTIPQSNFLRIYPPLRVYSHEEKQRSVIYYMEEPRAKHLATAFIAAGALADLIGANATTSQRPFVIPDIAKLNFARLYSDPLIMGQAASALSIFTGLKSSGALRRYGESLESDGRFKKQLEVIRVLEAAGAGKDLENPSEARTLLASAIPNSLRTLNYGQAFDLFWGYTRFLIEHDSAALLDALNIKAPLSLKVAGIMNDCNDINDAESMSLLFEIVSVALRNFAFAQNIEDRLCEGVLHHDNKPLVAQMGDDHTYAVEHLLKRLLPGVTIDVVHDRDVYSNSNPDQANDHLQKTIETIRAH